MPQIAGIDPDNQGLRIFIDTAGLLDLANLARFFQRVDVVTRRAAARNGWREPTIKVSDLRTGSVELTVQIKGLRLAEKSYRAALASLAISVASLLKSDAPSARACDALLSGDNATVIVVQGGDVTQEITKVDIEPVVERIAGLATPRHVARDSGQELLTGPQDGFVRRIDGEDWLELKDRPGLLLRVRDERGSGEPALEHRANYTFDGEAHIGPRGSGSFFVVRRAFKLG